MRVSAKGLIAIASHEAIVLTPYKDSVGVLTIGVGHTAAAGPPKPVPGLRLSAQEVADLFRRDITKYEDEVTKAIKVPLAQHEFDALVSFHFNTGGINRASLTRSINAGDKRKAADEFMNWSKPPEIIGRRKKEQKLFATGDYGNIPHLLVYDKYPGTAHKVPVSAIMDYFGPVVSDPEVRGDPEIWHVQRRLKAMGYSPGGLDGLWGGMTAGAITAFINDRRLPFPAPTSAIMFRETLAKLNDAMTVAEAERYTRPIAPERSEATSDELAKKLPDVASSKKAERVSFWTAVTGVVSATATAVVKFLGESVEWLTSLTAIAGNAPWYFWVIAAFAGSGLIYYVSLKAGDAKNEATTAFQEGARTS